MKVYLVRHGEAVEASADSERPLSDRGRAEVQRVAEFMKSNSVAVEEIWHSTKLRARQTAEFLQTAIGGQLEERRGLAPNDSAEDVAAELRHRPQTDVCVVSHLPFVSILASELLAGNALAAWNFRTAGVLCLEREATGRWWADWFISPDQLPPA